MWWPFKRKSVDVIDFSIAGKMEELDEMRRYTPDMARLELYAHHYVFVYGEMQKHHHQQEMVSLEERIGWEAFTQNNFHLLLNDLGRMSQPLLFHDLKVTKKIESFPVKGEIIKVKPYRFVELDKYYHNTVRFVRLPVMLVVPYTRLLFNDRGQANALFPIGNSALDHRRKAAPPRQTAEVHKTGVHRVWAQTYFAVTDYWFELLTDYNNPPIKAFDNPEGVVKKYSRFTIEQYDPPF